MDSAGVILRMHAHSARFGIGNPDYTHSKMKIFSNFRYNIRVGISRSYHLDGEIRGKPQRAIYTINIVMRLNTISSHKRYIWLAKRSYPSSFWISFEHIRDFNPYLS